LSPVNHGKKFVVDNIGPRSILLKLCESLLRSNPKIDVQLETQKDFPHFYLTTLALCSRFSRKKSGLAGASWTQTFAGVKRFLWPLIFSN
jgi:hypothetical protein